MFLISAGILHSYVEICVSVYISKIRERAIYDWLTAHDYVNELLKSFYPGKIDNKKKLITRPMI